jgi:glucose/arabinose dehydrogenase
MSGKVFLNSAPPEGGSAYIFGEKSQKSQITIHRSGDLSGSATVYYSTVDGTAVASADYAAAQGSVTFRKNQDRVSVPIKILNDIFAEGNETFSFDITSVSPGTELGIPRTATVMIQDDEAPGSAPFPPPPPTIQVRTEEVLSGLDRPMAFDWVPGQPSTMVFAEKSGYIKVFSPGTTTYTLLDLHSAVNDLQDRGLLDIELHPSFTSQPYLYAYYVVDPPETANYPGSDFRGQDGQGNRYVHLDRYTVKSDASTSRLSIDPTSKVTLLGGAGASLNDISGGGAIDSTVDGNLPPSGINPNGSNIQDYIAVDSVTHAAGGMEFGPDGQLYVTVGDGTSYNWADPRTFRVQDIDNLSGKVLRIDPLTGDGLSSNPFYNGSPDSNQSKVYQLGVRNAFRLGFDGDGDLFVGDVGWNDWEEINTGPAGANFGWPFYEGGRGGASQMTSAYRNFPEAQAFYAAGTPVVAPYQAFGHPAVQAIVYGDVYTGSLYPSWLQNQAFFSNLTTGEVFAIPTAGGTTETKLMKYAGTIVFMDQGPDGQMYFADISNGIIGRWQLSTPNLDLRLDRDKDRAGSMDLNGSQVSGDIYVFLQGDSTGVQQVQFLVDGRPVNTDLSAPWDLVGGTAKQARPFDTKTLENGVHSISAIIDFSDGRSATVTDSFTIANGTTSAALAPDHIL